MTGPIELRYGHEAGVAHLVFQRPAEGNTLDLPAARAFEAAVDSAIDGGAHVLVVTATGKLFCGGGDVRAMEAADVRGPYTRELAATMHRAMVRIVESDLIVICGVQGPAAGAGFSLVLNADYVVATERASFLTAYLDLGVSPDVGASYLLPRVVGELRASELLLFGRKLDAATAQEWGIVNDIVAQDQLEDRAMELARAVAGSAAAAVATKRLLRGDQVDEYRAHLEREADSIGELIETPLSRARQAAFLGR